MYMLVVTTISVVMTTPPVQPPAATSKMTLSNVSGMAWLVASVILVTRPFIGSSALAGLKIGREVSNSNLQPAVTKK